MSNEKFIGPLSGAQLERIAARFKILGEPMRLKILQAVCKQPKTVGEIVAATEATQANVSKHLALLAAGGILQRRKDGQRVYYGVRDRLALKMCELVRSQVLDH